MTKQTAIRVYNNAFRQGINLIKEGFISGYRSDKLYTILFRHKDKILVIIFGKDKVGNRQELMLNLDTFVELQSIKTQAIQTLFKGKDNGNAKNL